MWLGLDLRESVSLGRRWQNGWLIMKRRVIYLSSATANDEFRDCQRAHEKVQ